MHSATYYCIATLCNVLLLSKVLAERNSVDGMSFGEICESGDTTTCYRGNNSRFAPRAENFIFTCPDEGRFTHPYECTKYFICMLENSVLRPLEYNCPDNTHWNSVNKLCARGPCTSLVSNCVESAPGVQSQGSQWYNGRIPYTIDTPLSSSAFAALGNAIVDYALKTCIRIVPKSPLDSGWISIQETEGCSVGQVNCCADGQRVLYVGSENNCTRPGLFGHALCLDFEESRPDRDDYIEFDPGCSPGFKYDWRDPSIMDIFYDYLSLLHQSSSCYIPKLPGVTQLGSGELSVLDAEKINAYFKCPGCYSYRFRPFDKLTASDNIVPSGGVEDIDGVTPSYICRAYYNGDIIPGKGVTYTTETFCYVSYNGERIIESNFEYLTNPENIDLVWKAGDPNNLVPQGAIPGGRTANGDTLYIGRCNITIGGRLELMIPGVINQQQKPGLTTVTFNRVDYTCSDYDILVCQ